MQLMSIDIIILISISFSSIKRFITRTTKEKVHKTWQLFSLFLCQYENSFDRFLEIMLFKGSNFILNRFLEVDVAKQQYNEQGV